MLDRTFIRPLTLVAACLLPALGPGATGCTGETPGGETPGGSDGSTGEPESGFCVRGSDCFSDADCDPGLECINPTSFASAHGHCICEAPAPETTGMQPPQECENPGSGCTDETHDCTAEGSAETGCGDEGKVDIVVTTVTCGDGFTARVEMSEPFELATGFEGRVQFGLTVNGTLDGENLYASVNAISDDGGPFDFAPAGPSPLVLGPEDTFEVDADGAIVFSLSGETLGATGATYVSMDIQSFISHDATGISIGDDHRELPWTCD